MLITVFTPTYNRSYCIENLYNSLLNQSCFDFEWIVINDGSTDNTDTFFESVLKKDNPFTIKYLKTENGGKHRAINKAVKIANGELFFIVDSDDYLTDDSIKIVKERASTLSSNVQFGGISGLMGEQNGTQIGCTFSGDYMDCTYLDSRKNGIAGDKAEVYYTEVIKKYPFPEYDGEKFIAESVVWNKIAEDGYLLRYFNDIIYICEYRKDGLTANVDEHRKNSPRGYGLLLYQNVKYGKLHGVEKWRTLSRYYLNNYKKIGVVETANILCDKPWSFLALLIGFKLFMKIYNK